jgi:SAM-dependent methyltransferase
MHIKSALLNILKWLRLYHPLQSRFVEIKQTIKKRFYQIRFKKFEGEGLQCNVCLKSYTQFVASYPTYENAAAIQKNHVIAGYGENAICPNCLSTNRERLVIAAIQTFHQIDNKSILHLSPEKYVYQLLSKHANVITADLHPGFYKNIDNNIQQQDVTKLQFEDEHFDMVIANHILEHIPDDDKAIQEIYRVLKKNGVAILQVPYSETIPTTLESPRIQDPSQQSALYGQKDHVRIYQLNQYVQKLTRHQFTVKVMRNESLDLFRKFAIQKDECFLQ